MKHEARSMNSKIFSPGCLLPLLILGASIVLSYALIAQAQTDSSERVAVEAEAKGITYPVAELGNCGSKDACRDYCNQPGNMESCVKFAQAHGLMNKEEADRGLKFQKRILAGSTPGGCNSPESCKEVCNNINNLESCLKFADEQGFKEEKIDEARKILSYIKSGGKMPGGCTDETSCRAYCSDFNNAEECFTFAGRVGLDVEKEAGGEKLEPEQFKKFIELAKSGQTPGSCKSKEQCESYCGSETNKEECIAFGQKMGFMNEKKAELLRKTGGKGPGGCNSEETCRAYCNDPGRQEECFKFAEEHGLVNKEDIKEAKEGFVRVRQGLEQAPPEVAECLKSNLGPNIIQDIQSGQLTPGLGIGEKVRGCFEKFGHKGDAREGFSQAPPEITSCVRGKLGDVFDKVKSGEVAPTPEIGDAFRVCGEQMRLLQGGPAGGEGGQGGGSDIGHFLQSAPPGIAGCLREKLGGDFEKVQSGGTAPGQEVKETLKACFNEFRPEKPEPREFNPLDDKNHEGIKPAGIKEFGNFIKQEGSGTPGDFRPGSEKPGLNRETFEKFRQEGRFQMPEGFKPPEGAPQQFREQFQQQFQGEFQKQYDQQYQKPPEGTNYQPPPGDSYTPPPTGTTEPTSPPPSEPAPAPTTEPAPTPTTQGNIFQAIKYLFGF